MEQWTDQVAIISGGLGDIGAAIALELAGHGVDVAVGDVREDAAATALGQRLAAGGRRWRYDRVDVTDAAAVEAWVGRVEQALGPATLIIPNAATVSVQPVLAMASATWNRDVRIALDGVFHLSQAGARRLVALGRPGRIVAIGSWAAARPHPGMAAYCAAKAGVRMLVQSLALELAPHGILVNEVAPGYVDAGLSGALMRGDADVRRRAAARVPIGRLMTAADVARQVAHLCDPATTHLTGSTLTMDGGLSLRGADGA